MAGIFTTTISTGARIFCGVLSLVLLTLVIPGYTAVMVLRPKLTADPTGISWQAGILGPQWQLAWEELAATHITTTGEGRKQQIFLNLTPKQKTVPAAPLADIWDEPGRRYRLPLIKPSIPIRQLDAALNTLRPDIHQGTRDGE